ncbi:MAG TPA: Rrf2 family transcriptional regulator [Planctomycetes bacterium]|nr:Rrf2 family transcriptional regulator [Fuerstiella sp.]HIK93123.1 Rrf2 family transcriptional regulator [Planctomycetota bacterium]
MLSKTADYALRTVACLARETGKAARADVLAEETQVPRRYLNKVLKDLVHAELVLSRPGPGGGYSLAVSADEITILAVVNAVAPLERIRHCPLGLPSHTNLCPLHKELDKAYAATEEAFSKVTMGQLLNSDSRIVPLCDVSLLCAPAQPSV